MKRNGNLMRNLKIKKTEKWQWQDRYKKIHFLFFIILFLACLIISGISAKFSFSVLLKRGGRFSDFLVRMFPPDFTYGKTIVRPLLQTISMSVVGSVVGSAAALLGSYLCANGIHEHNALRFVCRIFVQIIRSVPVLICALFFTFLFGVGTFAGTAALFFYTFGIMCRLSYEDIENAEKRPFFALRNMGISPFKAFWKGILPQTISSFYTNALYMLEVNVRHSAILGYVGAGGIGLLLNEKLSWREYEKAGMILFGVFLAVILMELISEGLKKWSDGSFFDFMRFRKARLKKNSEKDGLITPHVFFNKKLALIAIFALVTLCACFMQFPHFSAQSLAVSKNMLKGLLTPNLEMLFDFSAKGIWSLLFETICIAFLGTFIGSIAAAALSFFCSFRLTPWPIAVCFRVLLAAVRTIPFMIYGLMFIRVTGPGAFAGALTLSVCSVGLLSKRFTESIDSLDFRGYHALLNMGNGRWRAIRHAIIPQLGQSFASAWLYRFDVNVREASVLGLVGAGGIGAPLIFAMNQYKWHEAGAILLGLMLVVLLVDWLSGKVRKKF